MAQSNPTGEHGTQPLARRLSLRLRCVRPEQIAGKDQKKEPNLIYYWNGLKSWQRAARLGEPSLFVKRKELLQPSSLERGSAATRTEVRSISSAARLNELTHISRINRR